MASPIKHCFYLGDGVYVDFSGYDFRLFTQRDGAEHYIVLEPEMIRELAARVDHLIKKYDEEVEKGVGHGS